MCNLLAKEHVPENQMPERVRQELNELATGKKHWTVLFTRLSGVDRTWLWCIEDPAIKFWKDKVSCQLARTGPDSAPWTAVVAKLHLKKKSIPTCFHRDNICVTLDYAQTTLNRFLNCRVRRGTNQGFHLLACNNNQKRN